MLIFYIDESYNGKRYVLCGFLLNDRDYFTLLKKFNNFLEKEFNLSENDELKGDELFNGRGFWNKYDMTERSEISKKIAVFLKDNLKGNKLIVIDTLWNKRKDRQKEVYLTLLSSLIPKAMQLVGNRAGRTKKHLMIVFDERKDLNKKEKAVYLQIRKDAKNLFNKYRKKCIVIDNGYEGISSLSRMLQISDFVAYFYRSYKSMVPQDTLFEKQTDKRKQLLLKEIFEDILENKLIKVESKNQS